MSNDNEYGSGVCGGWGLMKAYKEQEFISNGQLYLVKMMYGASI